jgi:adenylate cyclase
MAVEIERKFLVHGDAWKVSGVAELFRQGYLSTEPERTVRVRLAGSMGFLTIKGLSHGSRRDEFEYPIPAADAEALLAMCHRPLIEKYRYRVPHAGLVWEIDEFLGDNAGLVVAEVELASEEQTISLPAWVGEEVTGDARYYNASLVRHPYRRW